MLRRPKAAAIPLLVGLVVLGWVSVARGLVIRGDHQWIQSECSDNWFAADLDDTDWPRAVFPYVLMWQRDWPLDAEARPLWVDGLNGCVRRHFQLDAEPAEATVNVWVDDDYELYINGELVGRSEDGWAEMPGETYDVASLLRSGDNVIAMSLRDCVGEFRGALFALTVPGVPEEPATWASTIVSMREWGIFFGVLLVALAAVLLVRWLQRMLSPRMALVPPKIFALLAVTLAIATQWSFQAWPLYPWMIGQPILPWHWRELVLALSLLATLAIAIGGRPTSTAAAAPLRYEAWILAGILLLAGVLRVAQIDAVPPGFFQDEAINGLDAMTLWQRPSVEIWSDSIGGRPTLFLYIVGVGLQLFGVSYLSLKVVPIALGVLSVAALYAVGRLAFGSRAALWAAFLFAVSRWDIHFSRMAWEVNCVPLFSALGFALLLRAFERDRHALISMVVGAIVLTVGIYTYAAYRAIAGAVALFLLVTFVSRDRQILRSRLGALVLAAIAAAVVAAPLTHFALEHPNLYWARFNHVSLTHYMAYHGTPVPWLYSFGRALLSLNHRGDLDAGPFLDSITAMFFLVGITAAVPRPYQRGSRLTWCWFLTFAALSSLTKDSPHATRMLGMLPPAMLLAGYGAVRLADAIRQGWSGPIFRRLVVSSTVLLITAINAYQYFGTQQQEPEVDLRMNEGARLLCEDLAQQGDGSRFWTDDVAYACKPQCAFLMGWGNLPRIIGVDDLVDTGRLVSAPPPVTVIFGPTALEVAQGRLPLDENGDPIIELPARPRVMLTREGRPLYFIYRF